ncbi:MAG: glycosyltransferase [Candidatus Actinomarina sp.]|tara:strand:+ start:7646 stop:8590 length:945 start_codon:yes stop_codon:yes gene_type:complete
MKNPPKVSVLIRNLNEEEQLKILFSILDQQTYENFEVIFLDSGSSDNSLEFVKNYNSKYKIIIDEIDKALFTFGRALNICANLSNKPDYIISLSAHCFPTSKDFITNYVNIFEDSNCEIVYGKQIGYKDSMLSEASHLSKWFDKSYGIKKDNPFTNNGNCGYKFQIWEKYQFDENLTGCEDIEFASRALRDGAVIIYGEKITVQHFHSEDFKTVYFRYFREAIALNSIFSFKFSILNLMTNFFKEVLTDISFKYKNKNFAYRGIISILKYRFSKNLGHFNGFRSKESLNRLEIYYYGSSQYGKFKNNLYKKYFS